MKKKILIATILLLVAVILFAIPTAVKADDEAAAIGEQKYTTLDEALHAVKNGETIKLLRKVTVGSESTNASSEGHYADNGKVGRIETLTGEKNISFTLDLNGKTITSANDKQATFYVEDGSTMTIIDSGNGGKIEHTKGRAALVVKHGTVTLENVEIAQSGVASGSNFGAVQAGGANSTQTKPAKVVVSGNTKITSENYSGITVFGDGTVLDIKGGTITAKSYGIAGNGSSAGNTKCVNATINISDGAITSTENAAIYQPNSGTLNITGGTIKGLVGIVARQGEVNISGGKVIGTGTNGATIQTGNATENGSKTNLPAGAAIVTDNSSSGYGSDTTVNIKNGNLISTSGVEPIKSYVKDNGTAKESDYNVIGGAFSEGFNKAFIKNGKAEVSIENGGKTTYYVGDTAVNAVKNAAAGSHVTVEKGTLEIASLPSGVTFDGAVTVTNPSSSGDTVETIKSNLQALIAKAEGEENASAELTNAINTAKAVLANSGATYGELQQALANLQSAYDNFKGGNANANQGIVSGNESNTTGDKGKLDNEPKMGEGLTVFGVIVACAVLMLVIKSRKSSRR